MVCQIAAARYSCYSRKPEAHHHRGACGACLIGSAQVQPAGHHTTSISCAAQHAPTHVRRACGDQDKHAHRDLGCAWCYTLLLPAHSDVRFFSCCAFLLNFPFLASSRGSNTCGAESQVVYQSSLKCVKKQQKQWVRPSQLQLCAVTVCGWHAQHRCTTAGYV